MKLEIEINNLSGVRIRKDFFTSIIKKTLELSGYDFLRPKTILVSVAIVLPEEIRRLNKTYRKKNAVTDVLSFSEHKNRAYLEKIGDNSIFLGELVLCYNDIAEYAKKNKMEVKKELSRVVSHGLLHLLGFSHGEKMFTLQNAAAKSMTEAVKRKR